MTKKREFSYLVEASALASRFSVVKETMERIRSPENFLDIDSIKSCGHSQETINSLLENLKSPLGHAISWKTNAFGEFHAINDSGFANPYNQKLKQYYLELRDNIDEVKIIRSELKNLLDRADKREPGFFKTGNLKQSIQESISLRETKRLIRFGEEILIDALSKGIDVPRTKDINAPLRH